MSAKSEKGAKAPTNNLYASMPFLFTTVGNVRRVTGSPRFSRARMGEAVRIEFDMQNKEQLIIGNGETTFILSKEQSKLLKGKDIISDMYLNGWHIDEAPLYITQFFSEYQIVLNGDINNG